MYTHHVNNKWVSYKTIGMRWLNIYKYVFERKGHDILTNILRKTEQEEYDRDSSTGEIIQLHITQLSSILTIFPYKIGETTHEDILNIRMMNEVDMKDIIIVRGYAIRE